MHSGLLLGICVVWSAAGAAAAQAIPPDEFIWDSGAYFPPSLATFQVTNTIIEVPAVVRDRAETPVTGLPREAFLLFDNGKPQTISSFLALGGASHSTSPSAIRDTAAVPGAEPSYVVLFLDDINGAAGPILFGRDAAIKFVRAGLDPDERVAIFTSSKGLVVDFTNNSEKLLSALEAVGSSARTPLGSGAAAKFLDEMRSNSTVRQVEFAVRHLREMPGRRTLLVATVGFGPIPGPGALTLVFQEKIEKIIAAASASRVIVNALSTAGVGGGFGRQSDWLVMLSYGTGGRFLHNTNDLVTGYRQLTQPPAAYVLTFSPDGIKPDGSLHRLKVKLSDQPRLSIDARSGYRAPGGEASSEEKKARRLDEAVMGAEQLTELPLQMKAEPGTGSVKVSLHVPVDTMVFRQISGRHVERLLIVTVLFDADNHFLTGVEGVMQLQLKDDTLKHLRRDGLDPFLAIQAPAGAYRLRQVVQDVGSGRIAAADRVVEIR
jgi:VWFA-related protein